MEHRQTQKREKLADLLYNAILKSILSGELKEGDRLPGEEAMSETYKVSRPTIREALARLRASGLIVSRQGSGSFVGKAATQNALAFSEPSSIADLQRCFEYRLGVEAGAAAVAAAMRSDADLERLQACLQALIVALEHGRAAADEDFALHLAIADASRNSLFAAALHAVKRQALFSTNLGHTLASDRRAALAGALKAEYAEIIDAVAAGSPARAEAAMRAHITQAMNRVLLGTA